jgi:23S rRNA (adenine2503-C2)-methyltransferase
MTLPEIRTALEKLGARPHAAGQVFRWLHLHCAHDFESMTDLGASLRRELASKFRISTVKIAHRLRSRDGTLKFLLELEDGLQIETVFLTEQRRKTQCVSTQVGCPLGCVFCATASLGFERNLTAGEIVAQVEDCQAAAGRAANLVFMGMGEPFLNYDNVLRAIRILNDRKGQNFGARRITVSTAGIPEGMRRLAEERLQLRLALSLNATTDSQRSRLMPANRKHPLAEVLDALKFYTEETGRRATIEYVLIPGENDSDADLRRLTEIARSLKVNVNLIELNPVARETVGTGARDTAVKWKRALLAGGVEAVIRFKRGTDIHAGCGQLALRTRHD